MARIRYRSQRLFLLFLHLLSCDLASSVETRFFVAALISGHDLRMESRPL